MQIKSSNGVPVRLCVRFAGDFRLPVGESGEKLPERKRAIGRKRREERQIFQHILGLRLKQKME